VFEYLIRSEAGNVLIVTIGVLGFVARSFNNKLEEFMKEVTEFRKESAEEMKAMREESHSHFTVLTQAMNSLTNQISTKFVEQDVNIQWMRGDYGVVSRGHGLFSNQATKPATDEPSEDEDSFATNT
jgi:hypothetical protein